LRNVNLGIAIADTSGVMRLLPFAAAVATVVVTLECQMLTVISRWRPQDGLWSSWNGPCAEKSSGPASMARYVG
jgi:hypothetical protein